MNLQLKFLKFQEKRKKKWKCKIYYNIFREMDAEDKLKLMKQKKIYE